MVWSYASSSHTAAFRSSIMESLIAHIMECETLHAREPDAPHDLLP
jgi:hypothetical protein